MGTVREGDSVLSRGMAARGMTSACGQHGITLDDTYMYECDINAFGKNIVICNYNVQQTCNFESKISFVSECLLLGK